MKRLSNLCKCLILYLFVFERFWFYEKLKSDESKANNFCMDWNKFSKLTDHHILSIPYLKSTIENIEIYFVQKKNENYAEQINSGELFIETKISILYFVVIYDIVLFIFIILMFSKESNNLKIITLLDVFMKITIQIFIQFRDSTCMDTRETFCKLLEELFKLIYFFVKIISRDNILAANLAAVGFILLLIVLGGSGISMNKVRSNEFSDVTNAIDRKENKEFIPPRRKIEKGGFSIICN